MHNGADVLLGDVDGEVGLLGSLVGVVDSGEALDLSGAGSGEDAAAVHLLAVLERGGGVDEEEGSRLLHELASLLAGLLERSNGGHNGGGTSLGQLGGDKGETGNVDVTLAAAEAQLRGQLTTDGVAKEQRHGSATALIKGSLQGASNLLLATVGVTSEEDGETLLLGEGVLLAQHLDDLGVGEPLGDLLAGAQTVAQLGTRDVEGGGALGDGVARPVLVLLGEVDHLLELNHLDAKLLLVLLDEDLSIVGAVVVLAVLVLAGAGVVTADDEVGGTVVLADHGVPQGLTGTTHAHGEGQQGQGGHAVGVAGQESLVDTDTGEVVDVAGLGQTDDGVDEDVGLLGAGGTDRQLTVSTVHGVSGLESNDLLPAELVEVGSQLRGGDCDVS